MQLEPCVACRRHIAVASITCRFCGAVIATPTPRSFVAGRLSRAAAFASATLAGCYSANPPPQYGPTPPPPDDQEQHYPPPPPPQPDDRQFAKPPVGTGSIRGVVKDASTGAPIQGVMVYASAGNSSSQHTQTDRDGRYAFTNLPTGEYRVTFAVATRMDERAEAPGRVVTVSDGKTENVDTAVRYVQVPHHHATPYGAPPARNRLV